MIRTTFVRLRTRSARGASVSLGAVVELNRVAGPDRLVRFNLFPAADDSLAKVRQPSCRHGREYRTDRHDAVKLYRR